MTQQPQPPIPTIEEKMGMQNTQLPPSQTTATAANLKAGITMGKKDANKETAKKVAGKEEEKKDV